MTDRPIIEPAPMVRALLDGRKTQTRRVLKPQPLAEWVYQGFNVHKQALFYPPDSLGMGEAMERAYENWDGLLNIPHAIGDRLWVKEGFSDLTEVHGQPWERRNRDTGLYERGRRPFIWYRADGDQPDVGDGALNPEPWKSPVHMPRWASRLTLTVTDVRVQRVQEISEADALAEGIEQEDCVESATFSRLWDSLNADRGFGWDVNPWVAAITFTVERKNIDELET